MAACTSTLVVPANAGTQRLDAISEAAPCVYMLASGRNGTLYGGVTSDLIQRIWQHKNGLIEGFTKQHRVHALVCFEMHATMESAITREKKLKEWKRAWKVDLIEQANPYWRDLYDELL